MPDNDDAVWRVGHANAPLAYTPRELRSYDHRYDDPKHEYGTIYAARNPRTALREVLQDLRPHDPALEEFELLFGPESAAEELPSKHVTWEWRTKHALAHAVSSIPIAQLADLETTAGRLRIEKQHRELLDQHRVSSLDATAVVSKHRAFTRALGRALHDDDANGVRYPSSVDTSTCIALFEDRGELLAHPTDDEPIMLNEDVPDLIAVCSEWSLVLQSDS